MKAHLSWHSAFLIRTQILWDKKKIFRSSLFVQQKGSSRIIERCCFSTALQKWTISVIRDVRIIWRICKLIRISSLDILQECDYRRSGYIVNWFGLTNVLFGTWISTNIQTTWLPQYLSYDRNMSSYILKCNTCKICTVLTFKIYWYFIAMSWLSRKIIML